MDVDTLISAVFKRPTIWDKRRKDHANRNIVDACWKEIGNDMDIEESQLRKKCKSLRDYFVSECNKKTPARSGDAAEARSKRWQYFDQLLFLKDVVTPRASSGTFGPLIEDGMSSQQDTSLLDDSATSTGEASTRQSPSPTALPAESTPHDVYESASTRADQRAGPSKREQPRQAKRQNITDDQYKEILEIEKRKLEYFENKKKDPEDDDLLFLKSLLPYIKMIPTELKLHFRSRVQNVVTEFAFATTATNMQPSQSSVSCYYTTSTMRYPSHYTSSASTYTSTRPSSASPHSYQPYDNSESSYNY